MNKTFGPWFVEPRSEKSKSIYITDEYENPIAEIWAQHEETYANIDTAELMASAPKLFAQCNALAIQLNAERAAARQLLKAVNAVITFGCDRRIEIALMDALVDYDEACK